MEEWKEYKLGDVCSTISTTFKGNASQVVLINTSDVYEGKCLNHEKVENKNLKGQFKKTFQKDDILYSEIRPSNKRFAYIDFDATDYIASTKLMVIRSKGNILPQYLFYILKSKNVIDILQNLAETRSGTFPQITFNEIAQLTINLPTILSQRKIVSILTSLDDKIECNRKINENLEQQAQALFKSWFIDFEPFQDGKFVESELGMIPEGWKVGKLTDIAEYLNGLAMQKFPSVDNERSLPVLKIKELGQRSCDKNSDRCCNGIPEKYIINDGDIIFSWSGTLIVDVWTGGKCGLNQHLFKVTPINEYPKWLIYHWTLFHLEKFIRIAKDKAVTMGHIKRGDLDASLISISNGNILEKANKIFEPIFKQIINVRLESQRLATLRDTLLPKLMSGEIDVDSLEQ